MTRFGDICLPGILFAAVLLVAGWRLYSFRPRERIPGDHEGIEDPGIAVAFNQVARMPQMKLLRWFVARRAVRMTARGEAVDLGCGPGYLVVELARQAPELSVTGVDLSDEMLAEAEGYARRRIEGQRVSFKKGDVQEIPFGDGTVDLVVSTLSLHHWGDPVAVLDEVARVLRPGGSFLIFDLRRDLLAPAWLLLWVVTRLIVTGPLRRANEPMASRNAAYTPVEAVGLAERSRLGGWRVTRGPVWLIIEGCKQGPVQEGSLIGP